MTSEEGQERYDRSEELRIGAERQRQKSLNMNYTDNIHEDYVNERLDYSDNEEISKLEYNKYLEQAQRGMQVAPEWYRDHWERAIETQAECVKDERKQKLNALVNRIKNRFIFVVKALSVLLVIFVGYTFFIIDNIRSTSTVFTIPAAIEVFEKSIAETGEFRPKHGGNIQFSNNEWIILDLHNESNSFIVVYTSKNSVSTINLPIKEATMENYGYLMEKDYSSIEDFFLKNNDLDWKVFVKESVTD